MAKHQPLRGSMTALVTPFRDGKVDAAAFRAHVAWQIENGTAALVPVGTTGESPTLSHAEHKAVVEACIAEAAGRVPVIAGAGSNNTHEAIELAVHAEKAGADAVLVVTPYYNRPTQEGLYQHFKAVNDAVGIPIIIYNIPPRSVVDMSVETMARLFELPNIAGAAAPRHGAGFHPALRRGHDGGCLQCGGRCRLHFRGLQHRAAPVRRHAERHPDR
jgi:4-hydroxy-tetrahydrodipicolinate synthase